jgi:hypothetical protein
MALPLIEETTNALVEDYYHGPVATGKNFHQESRRPNVAGYRSGPTGGTARSIVGLTSGMMFRMLNGALFRLL